jgi:hypothetical protein
MQRLKALYEARDFGERQRGVPEGGAKEWLEKLRAGRGCGALYRQLDLELRGPANGDDRRSAEAARMEGGVFFLGEVRVAEIEAFVRTPYRFRTKRTSGRTWDWRW